MYQRKPYLVRKQEAKERARQWFLDNVENRSPAERRLALLRELTEAEAAEVAAE